MVAIRSVLSGLDGALDFSAVMRDNGVCVVDEIAALRSR
jgi:hypothetical protein